MFEQIHYERRKDQGCEACVPDVTKQEVMSSAVASSVI